MVTKTPHVLAPCGLMLREGQYIVTKDGVVCFNGGGGGAEIFIVNITYNEEETEIGTYSADKTAAEIYEAFLAGKYVCAIENSIVVPLVQANDETAYFLVTWEISDGGRTPAYMGYVIDDTSEEVTYVEYTGVGEPFWDVEKGESLYGKPCVRITDDEGNGRWMEATAVKSDMMIGVNVEDSSGEINLTLVDGASDVLDALEDKYANGNVVPAYLYTVQGGTISMHGCVQIVSQVGTIQVSRQIVGGAIGIYRDGGDWVATIITE